MDYGFQRSHVHVFDYLLHETIVEEAGVELDEILRVPTREIRSQIIEKLFPVFLLSRIDWFDSEDILLSIELIDCTSHYSCTSFPQYF
jgi:hypothetical protein